MSAAAPRALLRQSRAAVRRTGFRNASSTTDAAKEKAAEVSSKAGEGLSRVTSSAGEAASKVSSSTANAAGQAKAASGGIIGRVQSLIPRITYYSKVALELGKLVAQQRAMAPPSTATFQSYFQPVLNAARNPMSILNQTANSSAAQPVNILNRVRNMSSAQWLSAGVVAAEVLGFYTVGEAIGRRKLVGYRANTSHH